ncbi:MAG: Na+/H+ antiporter NhaC [Deltaproteobacteria bacterium]|nr:MAG: Na+/H+ antiporter NhaC [Deltaproteobacteria bacterium]
MNDKQESKLVREPGLGLAVSVLLVVAFVIVYSVVILELSAQLPIMFGAIFTALVGYFVLKCPWSAIEKGIRSSIADALISLLILLIIGALIGVWITTGIVPGLVYYGLPLLSPSMFLTAALLISSIVSLATGSSWSTTGTIGVALMGVALGLNIPAPIAAGVIISGAYFGDKMSPLSETTNLAPAIAGANLFDHIRAMLWSTVPTYIIVIGITVLIGMKYSGGYIDSSQIEGMRQLLSAEFNISPLCIVPPLVVAIAAYRKIPALPSIILGGFVAVLIGFFQGVDLMEIVKSVHSGYKPTLTASIISASDPQALGALLAENGIVNVSIDSTVEISKSLSSLLERGGIESMYWTLSLTILALALGGILETVGILKVVLKTIVRKIESAKGVVVATITSGFFANVFMADQYMAIILPGRMYKPAYDENRIAPRMLSRSIEDSATITSVLIPWNTCGAYQSGVLGVPVLSYLPYAFFNYLCPIVSILITLLGLGIYKTIKGKDTLIRFDSQDLLKIERGRTEKE